MNNPPFIKRIETGSRVYIYDVNSNEFIGVNRLTADILGEPGWEDEAEIIRKYSGGYPACEIQKSLNGINRAKALGFFSSHRPEIVNGFESEQGVRQALEGNLSQLVLEVTSQCNLRCGYCVYSSSNPAFRRHGARMMEDETGLRAIRFFIDHRIAGDRTAVIGFYGGEPLIGFDLIQQLVEYAGLQGNLNKLSFNVTTNGLLLTYSVIKFLAAYKFNVTVSVDGPEDIHDRFRKDRKGRGTFRTVMEKLEIMAKEYPDYFNKYVSVNCVAAPPYRFGNIIEFFKTHPVFSRIIDRVNINLADYVRGLDPDCLREARNEYEKLTNHYKNALIMGNYADLTLEKSFFLNDFLDIARRRISRLPSRFFPSGSCIPGLRRLFVDVGGRFFMCEKVGAHFEIGHVDRGLDYPRIYAFLSDFAAFFQDCRDCWAIRLCRKCFADIRKGEVLDTGRKEEFCRITRNRIAANLRSYGEILEANPDAFSVFKEIHSL